jgi:hypothetical protein
MIFKETAHGGYIIMNRIEHGLPKTHPIDACLHKSAYHYSEEQNCSYLKEENMRNRRNL